MTFRAVCDRIKQLRPANLAEFYTRKRRRFRIQNRLRCIFSIFLRRFHQCRHFAAKRPTFAGNILGFSRFSGFPTPEKRRPHSSSHASHIPPSCNHLRTSGVYSFIHRLKPTAIHCGMGFVRISLIEHENAAGIAPLFRSWRFSPQHGFPAQPQPSELCQHVPPVAFFQGSCLFFALH